MKVALGSKPHDGPWGGGNRFVTALAARLAGQGHAVVYDLKDDDIDLILLTDPRARSPHVSFGPGAIFRYLLSHRNALVVHRVNECDERKGEAFINARLVRANYVTDATVFVGEWLTHLPVWREHLRKPWFVIRNGADTNVFHPRGFTPWPGQGPLRLVTHHWGYHPMKGFDVYRQLDDMLSEPAWRERIAFTYIGNLPKGFAFRNARYVPPLNGEALATELRSHHAYITASINEPGGNHQNEGALCGLPLLYRLSGCMPEYCSGFGVGFTGCADMPDVLERLIGDYDRLVQLMPSYPHTAECRTHEWAALFDELMRQRAALTGARRLWRNPGAALLTQADFL